MRQRPVLMLVPSRPVLVPLRPVLMPLRPVLAPLVDLPVRSQPVRRWVQQQEHLVS